MRGLESKLAALVDLALRTQGEPPAPIAVLLPDFDAPDGFVDAEEVGFGAREGQTFMIEYTDAKGQASARRITVWSISAGSAGIPCLVARCHERKAQRNFRVDRIRAIIDLDGEVHDDVVTFLRERVGLTVSLAALAAARNSDDDRAWAEMRATARPAAILLAGVSLSDGVKHPDEIEAAAEFCARLCERRGLAPTGTTLAAFRRYLKGLRPDREMMLAALDHLQAEQTDEIVNVLRAARDVIEADGTLHSSEIGMLDDICRELTGVGIL